MSQRREGMVQGLIAIRAYQASEGNPVAKGYDVPKEGGFQVSKLTTNYECREGDKLSETILLTAALRGNNTAELRHLTQ